MTNTNATLRVSSDLKKRLDALSALTKRSQSFLANEAVSAYIHSEENYIKGISEAREQFSDGKGVPHIEAIALITSYAHKSSHTA